MLGLPDSPRLGVSTTSYSQIGRTKIFRRIAYLLTAVGGLCVITGGLQSATGAQGSTLGAASTQLRSAIDSSSQLLFHSSSSDVESSLLCPKCNCAEPGSYGSSPYIGRVADFTSGRTSLKSFWSKPTEVARYLLHNVLLVAQLKPVLYNDKASLAITKRLLTCPDQIFASNLAPLKLGLPTAYIYTRTGPTGRLAKIGARPKYMQRHVETIKAYNQLVADEGFLDGSSGHTKQLIWLVLEDEDRLDEGILDTLQLSGLPFIYVAHGPTRAFGQAQWNLALRFVQQLRDDFFGDGPVYNLDDDSYVLPMLFKRLWQIKRAMAWQVGNFHVPRWNSTWEGPFFENGNMTRWHVGFGNDRTFPIDMNGFAISSTQVGDGRAVHGPKYVPFFSGAGESEFLRQIYTVREDIEPLCWDTKEDGCYYVWHNGWMDEEVDEHHTAMSLPDYQ